MAEEKLKAKKKGWYQLEAPALFKNEVIGESNVYSEGQLIGKTIKINLASLINDMRQQNINIKFKVTSVKERKGIAKVVGYEVVPSSIRRFVRRRKERIDLSFDCFTLDKVHIRIKPFLLAASLVKGSVKSLLASKSIEMVKKYVEKKNYDDVVRDLITKTLQKTMQSQLKKIYPLKIFEIRQMQIEKEAKPAEEEEETKETEEKKTEAKEEIKEKAEEGKAKEVEDSS